MGTREQYCKRSRRQNRVAEIGGSSAIGDATRRAQSSHLRRNSLVQEEKQDSCQTAMLVAIKLYQSRGRVSLKVRLNRGGRRITGKQVEGASWQMQGQAKAGPKFRRRGDLDSEVPLSSLRPLTGVYPERGPDTVSLR